MRYEAAFVPPPVRNMASSSTREAARKSRTLKAKKGQETSQLPTYLGAAFISSMAYFVFDINENPNGALAKIYNDSGISSIFAPITGRWSDVYKPSMDKYLPDWPDDPCYAGVPPGTPAPPVLVVDLERTLIASEYDPKYGWRHIKRPGFDQFMDQLSQYYEIVVQTDNDSNLDVMHALDKTNSKFHKLTTSAAEQRGNTFLKRLDNMNRDIKRIILIDDSEEASSLFPRNTLLVKPFTDIQNQDDTTLLDLIPLLQSLVHHQHKDFRTAIDNLNTHDADEAVVEYNMRLAEVRERERQKRAQGLGGLLRSSLRPDKAEPVGVSSKILSASDIVGLDPGGPAGEPIKDSKPVSLPDNFSFGGKKESKIWKNEEPKKEPKKKKGGLFAFVDRLEQDKMEMEMLKREKIEQIYRQKMEEKAKKE